MSHKQCTVTLLHGQKAQMEVASCRRAAIASREGRGIDTHLVLFCIGSHAIIYTNETIDSVRRPVFLL